MLKKLACIFAFIVVSSLLQAEKLYEYRGVFPANRRVEANVTNYMLLNKASTVKFQIEEQDKGISDRLNVTRVVLTSNPQVSFTEPKGITRLELPETGIYEIKIEPESASGGEIRFILRVMEAPDEPEEIKPAVAEEPVQIVNTPSAEDVMRRMEQLHALTGNIQTVEEIDNPEPEPEPEKPTVATSSGHVAAIETIESVNLQPNTEEQPQPERIQLTDQIQMIAPAAGYYLSPLSGFTFSGRQIDQLSQSQLQEMISINLRAADGGRLPVSGSFFSMRPDQMSFLPDELEPGAVYHVRVLPDEDSQPVNYSALSLPELTAKFDTLGDMLNISLSWEQIQSLAPNPSGQLIALQNTKIVLFNGNEAVTTIDGRLQPIGVVGELSYRAYPYGVDLSLPLSLFETVNSAALAVEARIDGNDDFVTVFKAQNRPAENHQENEGETDFSMIPAQETEAVIASIDNLPDSAAFNVIQSFPVYQNDTDRIVAWPHEIVWGSGDNLWVLDSQRKMVVCYSSTGQIVNKFGSASQQLLGVPSAIAHEMGSIFVSDAAKRSIFQFDELGNLSGTINSRSDAGQIFEVPGAITFRQSEMWVVERGADRILCFDNRGSFLGSFSSTAEAPFRSPVAIRSDKDGLIILEQSGLVKKFSSMGKFLSTFQTASVEPNGLDVDPWGTIWVCDAAKHEVVRFSAGGSRLSHISAPPGPKPWIPTSVAVREDGVVAVADAQNKLIHIFDWK